VSDAANERVVQVVPKAGLHARPASRFVRTANEYDCDLRVVATDESGGPEDEPVNARSMLGVTGLGVEHDEYVKLTADGEDATDALDALEEVLSTPEDGDGDGDADNENASRSESGNETDGADVGEG
jgi:phosphocarrier protein